MSDSKKRLPLNHRTTTSKKPKPPPHSPESADNDDEENIYSAFLIDDEDEQLISNLLLATSSPSSPTTTTDYSKTEPFPTFKVRFVPCPYLPLSPFECSGSSYITINGNEETCGSSFSDADSSLMASVDTCGAAAHISDAFTFLQVKNDADFCSHEMPVKSREGEDDVWDWAEFLGEEDGNLIN